MNRRHFLALTASTGAALALRADEPARPPLLRMSTDAALVVEFDEIVAGIRETRPGVEIADYWAMV